MGDVSSEAALAKTRATHLLRKLITDKDASGSAVEMFDITALNGITNIASDGAGHCVCELVVEPYCCNFMKNLHGGCVATLVDTVGTAALATVSNNFGVSSHLSVEYISGLPAGETAVIHANVTSLGAKLANIEVRIFNKRSLALVATGMHQKYLAKASFDSSLGPPPPFSRRPKL